MSDTAVLEGPLADRDGWRASRCSVDGALGVVGTRSAMLIMREAYYGTHRFSEFARRVGITEAVAAARLRELCEAGLLRRETYREPGRRARADYHLTEMGTDLLPAVVALMQWGDRWLAGPAGPPLQLRHRVPEDPAACGATVRAELVCAAGHPVTLDEIGVRPGGRRDGAATG